MVPNIWVVGHRVTKCGNSTRTDLCGEWQTIVMAATTFTMSTLSGRLISDVCFSLQYRCSIKALRDAEGFFYGQLGVLRFSFRLASSRWSLLARSGGALDLGLMGAIPLAQ